MPVTIKPATHEILQSSFSDAGLEAANDLTTNNGFVNSAIKAYSHHHYLTIRPEDVWFAILSQLSIWINNHAEEARGNFVAHEGKKELTVIMNGHRHTVDYGVFAKEMTREIEKNVTDPELREWIMPAFTTTTANDTVVASILMMGALQEYFNYTLMLLCDLSSVHLQGEKSDWEALFKKLTKLSTLGEEPAQFAKVLAPVLSRFVSSLDHPSSQDIIAFWQQIFSVVRQGSGSTDYNG
ncbi:hypothetical protein MMC28_005199 [Mycoblastus sanguinarius]|nr:hypothetical protein [Mycoblastus sanguinarius]